MQAPPTPANTAAADRLALDAREDGHGQDGTEEKLTSGGRVGSGTYVSEHGISISPSGRNPVGLFKKEAELSFCLKWGMPAFFLNNGSGVFFVCEQR